MANSTETSALADEKSRVDSRDEDADNGLLVTSVAEIQNHTLIIYTSYCIIR